MEHREQRSHFVCNLFAPARHLSVKKKKKGDTFHNNTLCPALQEVTIKTKYLITHSLQGAESFLRN